MDDKKVQVRHRTGPIPELQEKYGLIVMWINHWHAPVDGFLTCRERYFEFYCISHLLKGRGRCILEDGTDVIMEEGDMVLVHPGMRNRYGGWGGQDYDEEAIGFYGPVADGLFQTGVIRSGVFSVGKEPFLLPMKHLVDDPSGDAQIHAVLELQKLLVELHDHRNLPTRTGDPVSHLLDQIHSTPEHWWTVEEMAGLCQLTVPRFRRHFRALTGTNPKEYCEQLKLRRAAEMLGFGVTGLKKVAHALGYADEYHFARRFKAFFGVSPGRYRRNIV